MDPYLGQLNQPETLHRYAFGLNDPVNRVDPSGQFYTIGAVAIGLAIYGVLALIRYAIPRFGSFGAGGGWEELIARIRSAGCPAWIHVSGQDALETARLINHFYDWYKANQYNMQTVEGGPFYFWADWACVDHAEKFAEYIRAKRDADPNVPLLSYYRVHFMGLISDGEIAVHTFLIARKRGLPAYSPLDIGINFDSWWYLDSAPNRATFYSGFLYRDNSVPTFDRFSDLF